MAVRPWENRFLDINLKDGVKILENGSADVNEGAKTQLISTGKKSTSNIANERTVPSRSSMNSNEKRGLSYSDGSSSSPGKSANVLETPGLSKPVLKDLVEETPSKPIAGSRSHSNPKERSTLSDKQGKKRLSLPSSGQSLSHAFPLFLFLLQILLLSC